MNQIQYKNLDIIWRHQLAFFKSGAGLTLLLLAACLGYLIAKWSFDQEKQQLKQQTEKLAEHIAMQQEAEQQLNFVRVEMEVDKLALQSLQQELHSVHQENAFLKRELTFFQNVMAPEMNADGVILDDFEIEPTLSAERFRYRVTLVQTKRVKRYAKGYLNMKIKGKGSSGVRTIDLDQIALTDSEQRKFNFKYFQIIEGEMVIPTGFEPERVELSVTLPKSRWQKYKRLEHSFTWQPSFGSTSAD